MASSETPVRTPVARMAALAHAQQRVGMTVDKKYRVIRVLGVGGMGVVYEAQHLFLGRPVALKVLHPRYEDAHDASKRFLQEASTLGTLGHRAIVEVLDGGFVDGTTPYLVMERLNGENLSQRIQRRRALRVVQAVIVLREIMKGLSAAHQKDIVHCDLKPENVFLIDRMIEPAKVKLLDFGVARIIGATDRMHDTNSGVRVYGTPEYMAPEQITGEEVGPRTDVYGAAMLAYEALTGAPPFGTSSKGRAVVFGKILREKPAKPIGLREPIPNALADLILRMLAKNAEDRPASPQEVLQEIDELRVVPNGSIGSIRAVKLPSK